MIKKQKKEQTAQFKELKMKLEILETNKEQATKLKKDIENFKNQVTLSNKEIAALSDSLAQLDEKLDLMKSKKESVRAMINELNMLKGKKQQSEQNSEQVYLSLSPPLPFFPHMFIELSLMGAVIRDWKWYLKRVTRN